MKKLGVFFLVILTFVSCKTLNLNNENFVDETYFLNGDLIFVEAKQHNLSGAINRATQKSKNENFDHVGIIQLEAETAYVLHAEPKKGSVKQLFIDFKQENEINNQKMVLYRLKDEYKKSIPNALLIANTLLGKPYNWIYVLNDNSYYCSDFIERSFRQDSVFDLIPMNFKDLKTGEIDSFWIDFYKSKSMDVPQDEPGSNPNQFAGSDKLIRIGIVK